MPRPIDLPEALVRLADWNALTIHEDDFRYGVKKLINALEEAINIADLQRQEIKNKSATSSSIRNSAEQIVKGSIRGNTVFRKFEQPLVIKEQHFGCLWIFACALTVGFATMWDLPIIEISYTPRLQPGLFLIAIALICFFIIGIIGMTSLKKWGAYCLAFQFILTTITMIYAGLSGPISSSLIDVYIGTLSGFFIGGILFWRLLKSKWRYFEGPTIKILGLKL